MVIPCAGIAAAQLAGTAGSAGATAMGLSMGKTDLELTRALFKMQMQQAKRLWTADWAEASVRHGEQCMQSAQQHSESQAMATATYFQAEKLASQSFKLARDQDSRGYEMAWRAEVRESLRDELSNQNNRFNIIMLCDTVCLSCVFSMVAEGGLPEGSSQIMINFFVFSLGLTITLFTVSLWCSVIVVRRLHEHTASNLERKLFAQSEDLQDVWKQQLTKNLPTGPNEMHILNQAYEKWVGQYLDPLGKFSIDLLSMGVVTMFVTAGLLTQDRYLIEYDALSAVIIFWSTVAITSMTVIVMKLSEDRKEKKKLGVYDTSWKDRSTDETSPFAKITRAATELFSSSAADLGSDKRVETFGNREKTEREFCAKTKSLHNRVESLRKESEKRTKTRKDILQLLTTASEELDALPEELTSGLNKILHEIDEADTRTANLVTMETESMNMLAVEASHRNFGRLGRVAPRAAMPPHPLDAQRIPVSLVSLRKKLGEVSLTTLLRLRNLSDEPLRLKSGVQLKTGKYIKSLQAPDPNGSTMCHHLYPVTEIPPRTEIVIAARSGGGWVPTSGIEGEIVYVSRDDSWSFRIKFSNELIRSVRKCKVEASQVDVSDDSAVEHDSEHYWTISREELDRKANNEVLVSFDMLKGEAATKAAHDYRQSHVSLKSGFLIKNSAFGLRLQWQPKYFELFPAQIVYAQDATMKKKSTIPIKDIAGVREGTDIVHKNVFEIYTHKGKDLYRLSAASPAERDDWIQKILGATGMDAMTYLEATPSVGDSATSSAKDGFECIQSDMGTQILQV